MIASPKSKLFLTKAIFFQTNAMLRIRIQEFVAACGSQRSSLVSTIRTQGEEGKKDNMQGYNHEEYVVEKEYRT